MSYSIEDAKEYVEENLADIMLGLEQCKECPDWMRTLPHFQECWKAGCWLNAMLKNHGATISEAADIGFVHGQRSTFGDPWTWAVHYLNEFVETKSVEDRPGEKLADQIHAAHFKIIQ